MFTGSSFVQGLKELVKEKVNIMREAREAARPVPDGKIQEFLSQGVTDMEKEIERTIILAEMIAYDLERHDWKARIKRKLIGRALTRHQNLYNLNTLRILKESADILKAYKARQEDYAGKNEERFLELESKIIELSEIIKNGRS